MCLFFPSFWITVDRKASLFLCAWQGLYFELSHWVSSWYWGCVDKVREHIGSFILALCQKSGNFYLRPWLKANWAIFFFLYPVRSKLFSPSWFQALETQWLTFFLCLFLLRVWYKNIPHLNLSEVILFCFLISDIIRDW